MRTTALVASGEVDLELEYTGDATGWVETNIGAAHSRRGSGKMICSATLPAAGDVKQ